MPSPVLASECTVCPSWVVRCAHLGDQSVRLSVEDGSLVPSGHYASHPIQVVIGKLMTCVCGGHTIVDGPPAQPFPDLPSAEAEFYRREEELLRG